MIKLERTSVMNLENAVRGARNPMNSWARSDSRWEGSAYVLGENDLTLAARLCASGSDHRKFLRQIFVSVDITAPLYWWKEFDTYKVGTVANSTSTMHKLHASPISIDDFSHDRLSGKAEKALLDYIDVLEKIRLEFIETHDKDRWYELIQLLPSSYHQMRTCTMTYENLVNMIGARCNHKLDEWHVFCAWAKSLPYAKELLGAALSSRHITF